MEEGKSIGKLYCDVEIRVNGSKYNPFNKLENISTKDLVEELKKRMGVEVVPHVGTWIEIRFKAWNGHQISRASRRHVD